MLYDNVKEVCKTRGIKISQMEQDLCFPRSSVCKWNENEPGVLKVKKVAEYLNVPIERILNPPRLKGEK